ncbi:serine/arginine-rich splicing factor SC35-like [Lotus japonicus]|uniref:serine/arginine-rich splicing factor SC35-like n=1 Tax=Lotus japonicus TaxID=34305 RepID=UPI00258EE6C0|nr:serine/arginine-rich splicing factor SC35-like [Lotus japonicus]
MELWRVFQKWGRLWDLYIPQKRDRWGRRFGFVKFLNVTNPSYLVERLDQLVVGGRKLHVNFPRFSKVTEGGMKEVGRQAQSRHDARSGDNAFSRPNPTVRPGWSVERRSYAEILTNSGYKEHFPRVKDTL